MKRRISALFLCLVLVLALPVSGRALQKAPASVPVPADASALFHIPRMLSDPDTATVTYIGYWDSEALLSAVDSYLTLLKDHGYTLSGTSEHRLPDLRGQVFRYSYLLEGKAVSQGSSSEGSETTQLNIQVLVRSSAVRGWTGGEPRDSFDEVVITYPSQVFSQLTAHMDEKASNAGALPTLSTLFPALKSEDGTTYTGFTSQEALFSAAADYIMELERWGYRVCQQQDSNGDALYRLEYTHSAAEDRPSCIRLKAYGRGSTESMYLSVESDPADTAAPKKDRTCPRCKGIGTRICTHCEGRGYRTPGSLYDRKGAVFCKHCDGTGQLRCTRCGGKGFRK